MQRLFASRTGFDYAFDIGEIGQEALLAEKAALERVCTLEYKRQLTRRYIAGGLAPHVVGYVGRIPAESVDYWVARGYSPDALIGLDGIEREQEAVLAGRGPAALALTLRGKEVRKLAERPAQPSQGIYLTIDRRLQEAVQNILKDAWENAPWRGTSTGGAAVVMDVNTGEILAIASYPDFNTEVFNPYSSIKDAAQRIQTWLKDPRKPTFNRASMGQYAPGSVFKIVSMAAAADSGTIGVNAPYYCGALWNGAALGDRTRYDWIYGSGQHGSITLRQALTGSCDIYFWHVGWTLNRKNPQLLFDYARRMGLGAPTGVKGISEAAGFLPDPATYVNLSGLKWSGSDALNAVIGQGSIQVTPLQITRMVAAIANGGTLYEPLIISKIGIIGEPSFEAKPTPNGKLDFKPEVMRALQTGMCEVTTNKTIGTAEFIFSDLKGVVVCGKTGSAQTTQFFPHGWFTAYAGRTADKPEIAVTVIVEFSHEGSFVAAPIVRSIVEAYYKMPVTSPWFKGAMPALVSRP
jgi:penicillin-binding protein 2